MTNEPYLDAFKATASAHAEACRALFDPASAPGEFRAKLEAYRALIDARTALVPAPIPVELSRPRKFWKAPERVEQLRSLIEEGLSGSAIAKQLNCSRNSVLGKAHRMGLKVGNSSQ